MIFAVETFVANLLSEKAQLRFLRFYFSPFWQFNQMIIIFIILCKSKFLFQHFQKAFFVLALAITGVLADVSHLGITTQIEEDGYH